jgi:hypothetical protein
VPGEGVIDFERILCTLANRVPHKANPLEYANKAHAFPRQVTRL